MTGRTTLDLIGEAVQSVDRAVDRLLLANDETATLRPALEARIRELELAQRRLVELRETARVEAAL